MKIFEAFATWNKEYSRHALGSTARSLSSQIGKIVERLRGSHSDFPAHHSDDMFILFRNLGFQSNTDFVRAFMEGGGDDVLRARLWRLWVVCWSFAESFRRNPQGAFFDIGTYNSRAINVALKYCLYRRGAVPQDVRLFDAFDDPPQESRKHDHSPHLHLEVQRRVSWHPGCRVVKGMIPESLDLSDVQSLSWAQVDLNSAEFDLAAIKEIFPLLAPGAIVVFDDYGASGYKQTQIAIDKFFAEQSAGEVLELPTSQGLYVR